MIAVGLILVPLAFAAFALARKSVKVIFLTYSTYVRVQGAPIEPITGLSVLWLPFLLRRNGGELLKSGISLALVALAAAQLISVLWSPEKIEGLRDTLLTLTVLASYLAFSSADSEIVALRTFSVIAPVVIISALSVAVFQFLPALELTYLKSSLSRLLIGDEAVQLFRGRPNNVLLLERSGGLFFVNSNRASMVLGVHAMIFAALSYVSRRPPVWRVLACLSLFGCFCSGSKTGLVLGILLPVACLLISVPRRMRFPVLLFGTLALAAAVIYLSESSQLATPDVSLYADSWTDRVPMWGAAAVFLSASPLLGLGFGGWAIEWGKVYWNYGKPSGFPPHNVIIANWTDSGLLAAVATIAIGITALVIFLKTTLSLRRANTTKTQEEASRLVTLWASGALLWAFIHALGDNTYVFGVPMSIAAYGCAMALVRRRELIVPASSSTNTRTQLKWTNHGR